MVLDGCAFWATTKILAICEFRNGKVAAMSEECRKKHFLKFIVGTLGD